jgi:hypothetical protein
MQLDLKIDNLNIEKEFERIAYLLLNEWILTMENSRYRITEIEFYYKSDTHNDDYTFAHELQKKIGHWYFHDNGADITFGDGNYYGGIFIRAIYNLDTKKYIYGPVSVLTELFRSLESVYKSDFSFGLVYDENGIIEKEKPIATPRVGLKIINNPLMFYKFYRFLVMPGMKHAEKTKIAEAMKEQGYHPQEINQLWEGRYQ